MGLAASQARFLGITARKSNIEYEGQQVNQQRTALAEEVNALYSKLLALELPIAPDTTKFYESNYSFEVSNATDDKQGNYIIKNYYENDNGTYSVTLDRTYNKRVASASLLNSDLWTIEVTENEDGTKSYRLQNKQDPNTGYDLSKTSEATSTSLTNLINEDTNVQPLPEGNTGFYHYDIEGKRYYLADSVVNGYNETAEEPLDLWSYTQDTKERTETLIYEDAQISFDANGRMSNISIPEMGTNCDVETTRTYDTEGYDAALRDYTMGKDEYDKMVADLNAQTESLQQEDKVLELRLNQIDTEQNELQTELEAVKAVLDKNIEGTFKTFA